MLAENGFSRWFGERPDAVWEALMKVLRTVIRVRIEESDPPRRRVTIITGVTQWSWGELMAATIEPGGENDCVLRVSAQPRAKGFTTRLGEQLFQREFQQHLVTAMEEALERMDLGDP